MQVGHARLPRRCVSFLRCFWSEGTSPGGARFLDRDLSYRVIQKSADGYYGETLRTAWANANLNLGDAASQAAIKQDPKNRWMLMGGRTARIAPR